MWSYAMWGSGWLAALLLVCWTRYLNAGYLIGAAVSLMPAAVMYVRELRGATPLASRPLRLGFLALAVALLVGGIAHSRFELIEFRWPAVKAAREREITRSLAGEMDRLQRNAIAAATRAAEVGRDTIADPDSLLAPLDSVLRSARDVDALAIFSESGELLAWAGSHRGPIPPEVHEAGRSVFFTERPLFSYLYYSHAVPGTTRHAVAALLVETNLTEGAQTGLSASFRDRVSAKATFHSGHPQAAGSVVWALVVNGDTAVHAQMQEVTQAAWRAQAEALPRALLLLLVMTGYLLLGAGWQRIVREQGLLRGGGVPLLGAIPLVAIAPLGKALGVEPVFSPMLFSLPVPGDMTLGSLVAALIPAAALVASTRRPGMPSRAERLTVLVCAAAVGIAFMIGIRVLLDHATPALLESDQALWFGLQLAGALLLTMAAALLFPRVRMATADIAPVDKPVVSGHAPAETSGPAARGARALLIAGVVLSIGLGAVVGIGIDPDARTTSVIALLWAVPFAFFAFALSRRSGRNGNLARWLAAGWLACTAVVPHLWDAHLENRLGDAERDLATLGTQSDAYGAPPDPYLDYLLESFGREAVLAHDAGETGVQLLYRTWVASGLAREPYEAEIMLWPDTGTAVVGLGTLSEQPTAAEDSLLNVLVDSARTVGHMQVSVFSDRPHMSRVLTMPLGTGQVVSVVVPPRRSLDRRFGLAYFLGGVLPVTTRLHLVEAKDPDPDTHGIAWSRDPEGWRSETVVQYPDGKYHAHLLVPVAPLSVRIARALLIIAFDLLVLVALWGAGSAARGLRPIPVATWKSWLASYRARVTFSLFAFFIIPTVLFGYVAYRALAQEVERATERVAQNAAEQAAAEFPGQTSNLREIALHTRTDVLRYHGGELLEVSSPEAFDLGVYGAWMPPAIYRALERSEEAGAVNVEQLGEQRLLTAFHSLRASGTLAVPMPLVSSDTSDRQRELAHLILFAALVGGILSLALSVVVGRALAGPIGRLTRASTAIGAGRLGVRLPENQPGEFGQVFESFNQMVRRLRRARSRELRTARVLAWGEMARQVAHEIKNPLTPIKLAIQHVRRTYNDQHPDFPQILETNVSQILVEIDRLSEISRAFSRYGAPAQAAGPLQSVSLAGIVREALTLYRTNGDSLQYDEQIAYDLPPILARPDELKEVLFNLIENARAAIDGSGVILVRAALLEGQVVVEVRDTGSGISSDLLPRIFDPHFSTRSTGTGLGLAIVRRLVESWGGTVEAESEEGQGTRVRLRLLPADLLLE
jgi:signal transduction histidine kinase